MDINPILRNQFELLTGLKQRLRDTAGQRWSAIEIYNAINDVLAYWGRRCLVPQMYSLSSGFTTGVFEYSLPWYITPPLDVQHKRVLNTYIDGRPIYAGNSPVSTWEDVPGWSLEPDGLGGQKLRLEVNPWPVEGRVIWWAQNGPIPTAIQHLNAGISAIDTQLTIAGTPAIGGSGYVKIGAEWLAYSDFTPGATTTTLKNLLRGLNGTTAALHSTQDNVYWGVAMPVATYFWQLEQQVYACLHNLYMTNAAPQETQGHIFQVRWYQQLADEFWKTTTPQRSAKMLLTRQGIGRLG